LVIFELIVDCTSISSLSSSNVLQQQIIFKNPLVEGLKIDVTQIFNSNLNSSTLVGMQLSQPSFVSSASLDLFNGPTMLSDLSTKFHDFVIGAQVTYKTKGSLPGSISGSLPLEKASCSSLEKYSLAIGLDRPREKILLQAQCGLKALTASYLQKFNEQLEVAYRTTWNSNGNKPFTFNFKEGGQLNMEVGAKYNLIGGGFIKAKMDNLGKLGLAFSSDLRTGVQLVLGAQIDTMKLNENVHRFGLHLNYSA